MLLLILSVIGAVLFIIGASIVDVSSAEYEGVMLDQAAGGIMYWLFGVIAIAFTLTEAILLYLVKKGKLKISKVFTFLDDDGNIKEDNAESSEKENNN